MTPEDINEAQRLLDASMADIPGDASDEEIDRRVHERTVAERTFMSRMAPPLLVDVKYWRRSCDGYKAEIERLTTWNETFIKQMTEAEADRDRARDAAVALEQQLAEIKKLAYIGGQSADFVRRQILGVFEAERRALGNSRAACAHCGQTILRRSSDGMWFSKAEIGPVTSDCNDAPDGLHAPAGGEAL